MHLYPNRREMLHGIGLSSSGLLLSPILTKLTAQAAGAPITQKRFVFVVESNGVPPQHLAPSGITRKSRPQQAHNGPEQLFQTTLKDRTLPFSLEPVKKWQDKLTIIQGLSGRINGGGHSNNFGALGCFVTKGESTKIGGETVDGALAKAIPGIFPHVGLGISKSLQNNVVYSISALAADKGLPIICKPDQAYSHLFGSVASGAAKQEFTARNNLLDFMKDDISRAEKQLAGEERQQLSAYLETFESLRDRQSKLNAIEHTLREKAPVTSNKYTSEVETDRLDAQFDIGAAALICGLTNVLTISSAAGIRDFDITFKGLGIQLGKHGIGHGGSYQGKTWSELYDMIRRYHFELIAGLMKKLDAIPEGNGTMLDNTVIVYLSDGAEGHHSRCWEWPIVVLGNIGNRLKTGQYIDYPGYGYRGHRTTANFFLTLLHLAGDRRETFGMKDPGLKDIDQSGPLTELLV
ncbi:MAG: DUF1552 domain-containing protein [Zavarzinella sp.]